MADAAPPVHAVKLPAVTILQRSYLPIRNRSLLWQFARRDVLGRYRGSLLGLTWSFLTPLLMLGVYSFVFVGVFRQSWPGATHGGGLEFSLQVFAGLLVRGEVFSIDYRGRMGEERRGDREEWDCRVSE